MLRYFALVFLLLPIQRSQAAPALPGMWLDQNRDGVIALWYCGNNLCARIAGVFVDSPNSPTPVDHRGVTQCNLPLVTDARQVQPGLWRGHITDPRNGRVWGVELHLDRSGNLALRGFLLIPLLGRTETWTRYTKHVPADCRIASFGSMPGYNRAMPNRPAPAR